MSSLCWSAALEKPSTVAVWWKAINPTAELMTSRRGSRNLCALKEQLSKGGASRAEHGGKKEAGETAQKCVNRMYLRGEQPPPPPRGREGPAMGPPSAALPPVRAPAAAGSSKQQSRARARAHAPRAASCAIGESGSKGGRLLKERAPVRDERLSTGCASQS